MYMKIILLLLKNESYHFNNTFLQNSNPTIFKNNIYKILLTFLGIQEAPQPNLPDTANRNGLLVYQFCK